VKVTTDGAMTFYPMPARSGPHGNEFDDAGRLWVTLEFSGQIVRLDAGS
jgi:virginiamycin B lyase